MKGTVVTAADHRYFRTLCQMLLSAARHRLYDAHAFVVYDIGMTAHERETIRARFPCRLETFGFDRYPPHVQRLVSCAWKPLAISEVAGRTGGLLVWLDSATLFHGPLDPLFERTALDGLFTLVGQSPLERWCHPETLRVMGVPAEDLGKRCRFGGALGFDTGRAVVCELMARWCECALSPACIDPPGATRDNHRFDQAVLTNLLYAFERERGLVLGSEEVDISSVAPVPWISTRNKVAPWLPLAFDPLSRAYHAVYKRLDRLVLRARQSFTR